MILDRITQDEFDALASELIERNGATALAGEQPFEHVLKLRELIAESAPLCACAAQYIEAMAQGRSAAAAQLLGGYTSLVLELGCHLRQRQLRREGKLTC